MKKFYIQCNIGKAKYVVNHYDGNKKHDDGSDFFDVSIFRNKKKLHEFVARLQQDGYIEI